MAIKNGTTDLSSGEITALRAADLAGYTAALAGTAAIHADETAAIDTLFRALRGRGIGRPVSTLLNAYFNVNEAAQGFNRELALACAATPGELDESRGVMNT